MQRLVESAREASSQPAARSALVALRAALSVQRRPPIREALDAGAAEMLAKHLDGPSAQVQVEAAWVLTNLCSGSSAETLAVVGAGLAEVAMRALLSEGASKRAELCNQVLWALGNMAADDDPSIRDRLLGLGIVGSMGSLFEKLPSLAWGAQERARVLRSMTWLASSLCRGASPTQWEEVECFFDYFAQVIHGTEDAQMLSDAMWGLCYLVEGDAASAAPRASRLLSAGFADGEAPPTPHPTVNKVVKCAKLAGDARNPVVVPALRLTEALLSTPCCAVTGTAVAAGAPGVLARALQDCHAPVEVRRDAAWGLANVARGTQQQAQRLVEKESSVWKALRDASRQISSPEVCRWATIAAADALGKLSDQAVAQVDFLEVSCLLHEWGAAAAGGAAADDAELQVVLLGAAAALMRHPLLPAGGFVALFERRVIDWVGDLQQSANAAVQQKAIDLVQQWFAFVNEAALSPDRRRCSENDNASPGKPFSGINNENMSVSPNMQWTPQPSPGKTPTGLTPGITGTPGKFGG